jgi:hypothetical protein
MGAIAAKDGLGIPNIGDDDWDRHDGDVTVLQSPGSVTYGLRGGVGTFDHGAVSTLITDMGPGDPEDPASSCSGDFGKTAGTTIGVGV